MFFLLRYKGKHMSALIATIDLAISMVRELRSRPKDHITCFCSVVQKPLTSSGKEDPRSHSYFTREKTLSATRGHIVTANKNNAVKCATTVSQRS